MANMIRAGILRLVDQNGASAGEKVLAKSTVFYKTLYIGKTLCCELQNRRGRIVYRAAINLTRGVATAVACLPNR